ncbi:hypothetical protein GS399_15925 [Pedobacter sp. HMF7647]|uniref:Uncharacterized protein n=1 Tax=Hufsiella arboris TaxID=2695275 RepID=A0A7K1YCZ9_9SPHI|nr:hypothetical protein [Hufsiella arboris]MXV52464.1 hypothetical protein [Hufsiella arboris]
MEVKNNISDEFNTLIDNIVESKYHVDNIVILEEFEKHNLARHDFKSIAYKLQAWKSTIYEENKLYKEAMLINYDLLNTLSKTDYLYPIILIRILAIVDTIKIESEFTEDDILLKVKEYLLDRETTESKLELLNTYLSKTVSVFKSDVNEFNILLEKLKSQYQIAIAEADLKDMVNEAYIKFKQAGNSLTHIVAQSGELTDKIHSLNRFIETTEVGFFRNAALNYKHNLEKNIE